MREQDLCSILLQALRSTLRGRTIAQQILATHTLALMFFCLADWSETRLIVATITNVVIAAVVVAISRLSWRFDD